MRDDDIYLEIKQQLQTPFMLSLFDREMMLKLLDEHKSKKKDCYKKIWTLYCLSVWHKVFFDEYYK